MPHRNATMIGAPLFYRLHFKNLKNDIYGGLTTAVVALPLSLAFGVASGLGPISGLYCAIFLGFFAALLGGAPSQISGPNGPMTVVMASVVATFPYNPELCFATVVLAGLMQVIAGWAKLGKYITLVPYSVISGFMSGVGLIIITLQLGTLSGNTTYANIAQAIANMPGYWSNPNWQAALLGLISLSISALLPKPIGRIVPSPLVALVAGTLLGLFVFPGAPIIESIPTGFPELKIPFFTLNEFLQMLLPALMLAVLGSIDSLMTATVADNMTRIYHKPNKELVGQGIGNMLSGLFGGLAGSGATMRTTVNIRAGGRTPISGALHALILLAIVLGLGSLAEKIPHAVLAGILLKVGYDIIDWNFIKKIPRMPRFNVLIMIIVVILTVLVDLLTAVAVGLVIEALHLAKNLADTQLDMMTVPDHEKLSAEEKNILAAHPGKIILFELSGPLSFGAATGMARKLGVIDAYDVLILDCKDVYYADTTSALAIEDVLLEAKHLGKQVYLTGLHPRVRRLFENLRLLQLLREDHNQPDRLAALKHFHQTTPVSAL